MRDSYVTDRSLFLPFAECLEMRFPVDQVVDLHQVNLVALQQLQGFLHLCDAVFPSACPHLRCDEELTVDACLGRKRADMPFGKAIHRRSVNDVAAFAGENGQHLTQWFKLLSQAAVDIEGLPGPHADGCDALPGAGNSPPDQTIIHRHPRRKGWQHSNGCHTVEVFAAVHTYNYLISR